MFKRFLLFFLFTYSFTGFFAQSFRFDYYGVTNGVPEDFAYSIIQDNQGYLLVSTDEGIYKFNGFNFSRVYQEEKVKFVSSFKTKDGTCWFGKNKGGLIKYQEGVFSIEKLVDGVNTKPVSKITDFFEDESGSLWVVTQNSGIFILNNNQPIKHLSKGIEELNIYSFSKSNNKYLIGTDTGLYAGELEDGVFALEEVEDIFYTNITCITQHGSNFLIGTESMGAFTFSFENDKKYNVTPLTMEKKDLSKFQINHIFNDNNKSVWVSTNKNGLIQLCLNDQGICYEMIMYNQGGLKEVKTVNECFIDREDNIWLASIDEGVVSLRNDFFSFYQLNNISPDRVAYALKKTKGNSFWIGTENRVLKCKTSPWVILEEYSIEQGLPIDEYSSLEIDSLGTVWVGSTNKGIYYKKNNEKKFTRLKLPMDYENKIIYSLNLHQSKIYASTDFGLIQIDNFEVSKIFTMKDGLPHNKMASVFSDGDKLMIASRANEISYLKNDSIYIEKIPMTRDYRDSGMIQYTKDKQGVLWVSTNGAGISSIQGKNSVMLTEEDGLMSNFVHSIICDRENQLWMTHRGGLSKYNIQDSIFTTYDPVEGRKIDFSNHATLMDENGRLWFGTNRGLLRYRSDLDVTNNQSPILNIVRIEVNKRNYANPTKNKKIKIDYNYKKKYSVKVQFEGISLKKPDGVVYYYMLKGFHEDWKKTTRRELTIDGVTPGDYTFLVKAYNADGIGGDDIKKIRLYIDRPIWEKWWFYALLIATILVSLIVTIKVREKRFKKTQEYLQTELNARTKEVVSQKEVLEVINNDLTDSIEYAKNIQTAILPAPNTLTNLFGGACIFYKPRDIVSGDFYWVEKYKDKVTIAVADCTGHGVPGAFMSLIGSALLKDITARKEVSSPDLAMIHLDKELKEMLNKKDSRFGVHDGMDITIVEFDFSTNILKICSGKRPVLLYIKGEQVLMKGDRASVGGYGETKDKNFTVTEYQLHKGDRFYMYSDGIVDQFGGERGKKLKNRAFVAYVDSIQHLPIQSQRENLDEFFENWMGDLAQIDDVIVVGIEV